MMLKVQKCFVAAVAALALIHAASAAESEWSKHRGYVLSGSGTTNPSKYIWWLIEKLTAEIAEPVKLNYRAVGSGIGHKEAIGNEESGHMPYADFNAADIPLNDADYKLLSGKGMGVAHIPMTLGAIGIFHSVKLADGQAIDLKPCTLAQIFAGTVTKWNAAEIKASNPGLDLPDAEIKVVHRTAGSSSTSGLTQYLDNACAPQWSGQGMDVGKLITWPSAFQNAHGSGGVSSYIANTENAIGYVDAGHGHDVGLNEIKLQNKAGRYMDTKSGDVGAAAEAAISNNIFPAKGDGNFEAVNLLNMDGPKAFPITLISYFIVRTDLSAMNPGSAALLHALITFTMGEGQSALTETFGFFKLPQALIDYNLATLEAITYPVGMKKYTFEGSKAKAYEFSGTHVVSQKRRSFAEYERATMTSQIAAFASTMADINAQVQQLTMTKTRIAPLHGAGTTNPSKFLWKVLDFFEKSSKVPIHSSYRGIGSSAGQKEIVGADNDFEAYNDFAAGDIPMSGSRWKSLDDNSKKVAHIPFAAGAIAFFYNLDGVLGGSDEVDLDACLLAKVFSRQIKFWDHDEIKAANPAIAEKLPHLEIKVVHRVKGSSSTTGITEYLASSCPAHWKLGYGSSIDTWPEDTFGRYGSGQVTEFIDENKGAIGYLDSGHGHSFNLKEIAVKNKDGKYIRSVDADIGIAVTKAIAAGRIPKSGFDDWSKVNFYDLDGPTTFPITMVSYFYIRKNLLAKSKDTAALLVALLEYVISDDGQDMISTSEFKFSKIPQGFKDLNAKTISELDLPANTHKFSFELGSTKIGGEGGGAAGAGEFVISRKRQNYVDYKLDKLDDDVRTANHAGWLTNLQAQVNRLDDSDTNGIIAIAISCVALLVSLYSSMKKSPKLVQSDRPMANGSGKYEMSSI